MKPPSVFIEQPVRSLQTMLRVLAEQDSSLPSLIPDGIYGRQTTAAVTAFQRRHGLPLTGVADQDTWDAIYNAYASARIYVEEAKAIEIDLEPNQIIRRNERNPNVYLAQAILTVLAEVYSSVTEPSSTGVIDIPTSQSLESFQSLHGLPVTGELDRLTWHYLAYQYPLAARQSINREK